MVTRSQLETVIRTAHEVTGEKDFVIIGSVSILGSFPQKGESLILQTHEVDLFARDRPEKCEMLEGHKRDSPFHMANGIWIDPVGPTTAVLPPGWEKRLVKFPSTAPEGAVGWCLEPHDLTVAKMAAHRPKDCEFVQGLFENNMIKIDLARQRLEETKFAHHQIKNMAADHLEQCYEDAQRSLKKKSPAV